jgi:DNA replication protein DnaC
MLEEMFPDGPPDVFHAAVHADLMNIKPGYRAWFEGLSDIERAGFERQVDEFEVEAEKRRKVAAEIQAQHERWSAEMAEKNREADERRAYEMPRHRLAERGVPVKDIERIVTGDLTETTAMKHARAFVADKDARALVLSGGRGCGKTTAASWIVGQRWHDEDHDTFGFRIKPIFIDVSRLSRLSRYKAEDMDPLERSPLLAIDDLGMEYADEKGNFLSTLDGIFNARYAAGLRTVITTNLTHEAFSKRYGERVIDRIRETGRFFEMADKSLRGRA